MGSKKPRLDLPTKLVIAAVGGAAVLTALPGSAEQSSAAATGGIYQAELIGAASADAIPGNYIVVLRSPADGEGNAALESAVERAEHRGASVTEQYGESINGYAATMGAGELAAIRQDPEVAYVAVDQTISIDGSRDVTSWGQDRIDQRSGLDGELETSGDGSGVNAYIIDTGIRSTHEDFDGRVTSGYTAVSDGNGTEDCNGHGTHVAGTVGGSTYGVAPGVGLVAVRVLDCDGVGTASGVIAGIDWVTANHVSPAVANMSLGGSAYTPLDSAVAASIASGVTYALAAGNESDDACDYSPARTPAAITVAASTDGDTHASFSNDGSCVDLYAPGSAIRSDYAGSDTQTAVASGTSMASPHVAGAAALQLAADPSATPAEVAAALVSAATPDVLTDVPDGTANLLLYVGESDDVTPTPTPTATTTAPVIEPTTEPTTEPTPTTTPTPTATATPSCPKNRARGRLSSRSESRTMAVYTSTTAGAHAGCMTGPRRTNFDLVLEMRQGGSWVEVASGHEARSRERVFFTGEAGTYRWRAERVSGRGGFVLRIAHPE